MAKMNPDAGRITKVEGLVTQITDDERNTRNELTYRITLANPTVYEGSGSRTADKDFPVSITQGSKSEGIFARSLQTVTGDTDLSALEGKYVQIEFQWDRYTTKDNKVVEFYNVVLSRVSDNPFVG